MANTIKPLDKTPTRGAPFGNRNRQINDEPASSNVQFRCLRADKIAWVKMGEKNGGLSAWIIKTLNDAIDNDKKGKT